MITEEDKLLIQTLQENLPLTSRPFRELAERLGMDEQYVISKIRYFKRQGILRRLGAVIRPQNLGYEANAMVVWEVPEEEIALAGSRLAFCPEISHCYQRATTQEWTYNLFTVLHAETEKKCKELARYLSQEIPHRKYRLLFSSCEFKKTSMKYFREQQQ